MTDQHVPDIGELISAHAEGRLADYFPEPATAYFPEPATAPLDPDEPTRGIELPETLSDLLREAVAEANSPSSKYKQKPDREGNRQYWPNLDPMGLLIEWITPQFSSWATGALGPGPSQRYVRGMDADDVKLPGPTVQKTERLDRENERTQAALYDLERNEHERRELEIDIAHEAVERAERAKAEAEQLLKATEARQAKAGPTPSYDRKRAERARSKVTGTGGLSDGVLADLDRRTRRQGGHVS